MISWYLVGMENIKSSRVVYHTNRNVVAKKRHQRENSRIRVKDAHKYVRSCNGVHMKLKLMQVGYMCSD